VGGGEDIESPASVAMGFFRLVAVDETEERAGDEFVSLGLAETVGLINFFSSLNVKTGNFFRNDGSFFKIIPKYTKQLSQIMETISSGNSLARLS
jgi:hypothetical protein